MLPSSLSSSSFRPPTLLFLRHSLVLFDLFREVQMSQQRERSGKGSVLSKVRLANAALVAWGESTLTLETLNTGLCVGALLSPPLRVDVSQLRADSRVICARVERVSSCVHTDLLIWVSPVIEEVTASWGWHMALLDIGSEVTGCQGFTASCLQRTVAFFVTLFFIDRSSKIHVHNST